MSPELVWPLVAGLMTGLILAIMFLGVHGAIVVSVAFAGALVLLQLGSSNPMVVSPAHMKLASGAASSAALCFLFLGRATWLVLFAFGALFVATQLGIVFPT